MIRNRPPLGKRDKLPHRAPQNGWADTRTAGGVTVHRFLHPHGAVELGVEAGGAEEEQCDGGRANGVRAPFMRQPRAASAADQLLVAFLRATWPTRTPI